MRSKPAGAEFRAGRFIGIGGGKIGQRLKRAWSESEIPMRHETITLKPRGWSFHLDRLIAVAIMSMVTFRIAAIPFALLWSFEPPLKRKTYLWITTAALLMAVASPIDIGLPTFGRVEGNVRSGVRWVRANGVCQPCRQALTESYGEFILVYYPGIYTPYYILVWW